MKADLHMHSEHSDGTLSIAKLVSYAKTKHLNIIAITDHDSTSGVHEAIKIGNELNIKVIPGIELSTYRNNESVHILGYFDGVVPEELVKFSDEILKSRRKRIVDIAENCRTMHNLKYDEKRLLKPKGMITRAHLIRELAFSNPEYSREQIALNFLQEDQPAYIPSTKISTEEGIKFLKDLNAFVVLAHPTLLKKNDVEDIIKLGIDGLEGIYPKNKANDEEKFRNLCKQYNLVITAGSDYHGIVDYSHEDLAYNVLTGVDLEAFLSKLGEKNENK